MNLKQTAPEEFGRVTAFLYAVLAETSLRPFYQAAARQVTRHLNALHGRRNGVQVLDLGAGTAALARLMNRLPGAPPMVALDASESMLAQAVRRSGPRPGPGMVLGRGEALPFTDASLDLVLSSLSFHHWEDPAGILAEIHRILRPGGSLWTFEPDPNFPRPALRRGMRRFLGIWPPVWLLRRGFRRHGFSASEYQTLVAPAVARSPFRGIERVEPFLWLRWMVLTRAREPGDAGAPQG
ncbi:MAG: class I SAM-dependent methyltransferase [Acidobacteriota bacterium]